MSVAPKPVAASVRPFGLGPELTTFYKTRAHARALETLIFGLRSRERFLLVTGESGTGKTVLCRALLENLRSIRPVSFVPNPQLTPSGLYGLLLDDFAYRDEDAPPPSPEAATPADPQGGVLALLASLRRRRGGPVIVVDDAHTMPAPVVERLLALSSTETGHEQPLQIVLVGRARPDGSGLLGIAAVDDLVSTRTRLSTLTRDECDRYVRHRLAMAGCSSDLFTARAIGLLHSLSGGIPLLLNLIAERALDLTQGQGAQQIDSGDVAAVAASLDALFTRPRRFRWFGRRVS